MRGLLLIIGWGALFLLAGCLVVVAPAPPSAPPALGSWWARPFAAPLEPAQAARLITEAQVVLVGEVHNHPGHHQIQAQVIQMMLDGGLRPVVGVEWLDHEVQPICQRFSQGQLTVAEFARQVDWTRRWGHSLTLYTPLLELVQRHRLTLAPLNAPSSLIRQVAHQGLAGLKPAERAQLAPSLDLTDPDYRAMLDEQFVLHGMAGQKMEEYFFQAQVARDETMAWRLAQALAPWPDGQARAVVLAGAGHLAHGLGLPGRIARRLPHVRLLSVLPVEAQRLAQMRLQPGAPPADLMVVAAPAPPRPPRLGVMLSPGRGGLKVERVLPGSPAQAAGIQPGDLLTQVDGRPLTTVKDIHDALKAAPHDPHSYQVSREGKELSITISLPRPSP